MPRRYRIAYRFLAPRISVPPIEVSGDEFAEANDSESSGDLRAELRTLTLGQSVTLGGGAAPITVITCIEE